MPCWTRSMPILRQCGRRWNENSPARSSRITLIGLIIELMGQPRYLGSPRPLQFHQPSEPEILYAYAASHEHFYINDIDYLSADYGLTAWGDAFFWHMYKYAMCLDATPFAGQQRGQYHQVLVRPQQKSACARPGQYALGRHRRRRRCGRPRHRPRSALKARSTPSSKATARR